MEMMEIMKNRPFYNDKKNRIIMLEYIELMKRCWDNDHQLLMN
jgi:hypothetical protein